MGFSITETMSGTHRFVDGAGPPGEHPFSFTVRWGPERVWEWANPRSVRFMWQPLEGVVEVGGLVERAPCVGTLELDYAHGRIHYCFDTEIDGVTYRYDGEKVNIKPHNLLFSHTTCYGTLVELHTGRLVSRSVTYFKLRELPRFVGSLRWRGRGSVPAHAS